MNSRGPQHSRIDSLRENLAGRAFERRALGFFFLPDRHCKKRQGQEKWTAFHPEGGIPKPAKSRGQPPPSRLRLHLPWIRPVYFRFSLYSLTTSQGTFYNTLLKCLFSGRGPEQALAPGHFVGDEVGSHRKIRRMLPRRSRAGKPCGESAS